MVNYFFLYFFFLKIPNIIKKNDIDGKMLLELSEYTMKDQLGMDSYGARHNFMNCINTIKDVTDIYKLFVLSFYSSMIMDPQYCYN